MVYLLPVLHSSHLPDNFHDFSPAGVATVDGQGVLIEVNRKFAELFGYDLHELDGQHLEVLLPMSIRERHKSLFASMDLFGQGRTLNNSKPLACIRKDGQPVHVLIGLRPVRQNSESGNPDGWLVHVCDVTELVKSSDQLRATLAETLKQKEQIKAMLHQREVMLRVLSHELRTPLSVVTSFLEGTLSEDTGSPQTANIMANIGDRLTALSKVSQVWLGQTDPIDLSKSEPKTRILNQVKRITNLHQVDPVIVRVNFDASMAFELQLDWHRFDSILRRSLSLAFRNEVFRDSGIELKVWLSSIQADRAALQFQLSIDNGSIIDHTHDPDQLPIDIDQVLIEALSEQMAGHSTIVKEGGLLKGVSFICPVALCHPDQQTQHKTTNWQGLRVFLVEDEPLVRKMQTIQLQKWGARVHAVSDGQMAIEHLQATENGYDLVLMDLHMPVKNGFDCTREMRASFPERCPVIVALTAGGTAGDRARAFEAGVDGFFLKPLKQEDLSNMLSAQPA